VIVVRRLASNPFASFCAAGITLAAHVWWSYAADNADRLPRCGALWAIIGALVIARPVIRLGYRKWYAQATVIDGGTYPPSPQEIEDARQQAIDARCIQVYGPALIITGTALWAYGDFLAHLIGVP